MGGQQSPPVVASNSDMEMVHYLYAGFEAMNVKAPRSVVAAAASQKSATELILKSPVSTAFSAGVVAK